MMVKRGLHVIVLPILLVFSQIIWAVPANPAVITGTTAGGVGNVTSSSDINGINAQIGRFDTPFPGGLNGPPVAGLEPLGESTFSIGVDVNDGGRATFSYILNTYDSGLYDWYDISLVTPTGTISLLSRLGKPGNDFGVYYSSPQIPLSVSLDRWKNQHVTFEFSVRQDGYGDQTQGQVIAFNVMTCPVPPLTPITDPIALQFEGGNTVDTTNLQANMQTALGCLRTAVAGAGGSINITSAYRPPAYQRHLREVWDNWQLLRDRRDEVCQELRTQVQTEFTNHQLLLTQRPASANGPHTQGAAIDMVSTLPLARFLTLTTGCQLIRPLPVTDRVHFTHQ